MVGQKLFGPRKLLSLFHIPIFLFLNNRIEIRVYRLGCSHMMLYSRKYPVTCKMNAFSCILPLRLLENGKPRLFSTYVISQTWLLKVAAQNSPYLLPRKELFQFYIRHYR